MRFYTHKKKKYTSVTSVLSLMYPFNRAGFESWCVKTGHDADVILGVSTLMGSKVSDWLDNEHRGLGYLNPPVVGPFEKGLMEAVRLFTSEHEILDTERTVFNDDLMYAGTFDGIVMLDGVKTLVDWKTYSAWSGKYKRSSTKIKKVRLQLSMYRETLKEELPLAVIIFKTDGTYEVEHVKFDTKALDWWEENKDEHLI